MVLRGTSPHAVQTGGRKKGGEGTDGVCVDALDNHRFKLPGCACQCGDTGQDKMSRLRLRGCTESVMWGGYVQESVSST